MGYQKLTPIIATGSSAPRYLGDRFSDIVNLKDFGAAGDGVTDDSTAWAAWKAALQNGGMPFIPKGDYLLGEEIVHAPKGHFGRNVKSFSYEDDGVVLDEFSAPVYVDPNGLDTNDGMSATTAVQTFEKALQIGKSLPGKLLHIVVAGGAYTQNLVVYELKSVYINLLANVTITGKIEIANGSDVIFANQNCTLTVNGRLTVSNHSSAVFYPETSVTNSGNNAISVFVHSSIAFNSECRAYTSSSSNVIYIGDGSELYSSANIYVIPNSQVSVGFEIANGSKILLLNSAAAAVSTTGGGYCDTGVLVSSGSMFKGTVDIYDSARIFGVFATQGSVCKFVGRNVIVGETSINEYYTCVRAYASHILFNDDMIGYFNINTAASGSRNIALAYGSMCYVGNVSELSLYLQQGYDIFDINNSRLGFMDAGTTVFAGTSSTSTMYVGGGSTVYVSPSANLNTGTSGCFGTRVKVRGNSTVSLSTNGGQYRIPGNANPDVASDSYYG